MPMIDHITDEQADLIRNAKVFFVASADPSFGDGPNGEGPVNLSPKGAADLQVIDEPHHCLLRLSRQRQRDGAAHRRRRSNHGDGHLV